jgi:hypothetical protein
MSARTDHCWGCGEPQPDWPAGWLALDDGRHYCPACRKNVYLLRTKWGADTSGQVTSDDVFRALGVDDDRADGGDEQER